MHKPDVAFPLSGLSFPLKTQNNTRPDFSLHLRCCAAVSGMKSPGSRDEEPRKPQACLWVPGASGEMDRYRKTSHTAGSMLRQEPGCSSAAHTREGDGPLPGKPVPSQPLGSSSWGGAGTQIGKNPATLLVSFLLAEDPAGGVGKFQLKSRLFYQMTHPKTQWR